VNTCEDYAKLYLERCNASWQLGYVGFADMYRRKCESKPNNEIDKELHAELVKLDSRLGTKASKQLYKCLKYTTRSDIIKVGGFLV